LHLPKEPYKTNQMREMAAQARRLRMQEL